MSVFTAVSEEKMKKTIANFESEMSTIRAGRANPNVLNKIMVDNYGTMTPVNQVGNVTVPDGRVLQIQPWDASMLKAVEKAIMASDLGINPSNDGKIIRLVFPELTEERRKSLSKDIKKMGEEAKVAVRNIRRDAVEGFKKQEKTSEMTADDLKKAMNEIQKLTDKKTEEIDKAIENKTKEIMSI
jgi:ribosome recycling factor